MDVRRTSTTYYNKDTPEVATFFSRRITNFSRYFLGSLTGWTGPLTLISFCDILRIEKKGALPADGYALISSFKMTAKFARLGRSFSFANLKNQTGKSYEYQTKLKQF